MQDREADVSVMPCGHDSLVYDNQIYPHCAECGIQMTMVPVAQLTDWVNVRVRIKSLILAEEQALKDRSLSRQERLARKATRDAYRMTVDIMDESGVGT